MKFKSVIVLILTTLLLSLAMYHLKFRQTFLVKVGMTGFFSPMLVPILSYIMPILTSFCALFLLLRSENKIAVYCAIFIFSIYTLYNLSLFIKTGDDCGCANFFINIDLHKQIIVGIFAIILSVIAIPRKISKVNM